MEGKVCTNCGEWKELTDYYVCTKRGARRGECKTCAREKRKAAYWENPELNKMQAYAWRDRNPERFKAIRDKYNAKPESKLQQKTYRQENKEKVYERQAKYKQNNKEKISKYSATYYQDNKDKITKRTAEYKFN
jgi:hypothetical protein